LILKNARSVEDIYLQILLIKILWIIRFLEGFDVF